MTPRRKRRESDIGDTEASPRSLGGQGLIPLRSVCPEHSQCSSGRGVNLAVSPLQDGNRNILHVELESDFPPLKYP